jgi:hypothetical protein
MILFRRLVRDERHHPRKHNVLAVGRDRGR